MAQKQTEHIIKFVHFAGTNSEWEHRRLANVYRYSIVFGQIFAANKVVDRFIYAGEDVNGLVYEYHIPVDIDVADLERRVTALEELVNIEGDRFTSETFKIAVENTFIDSSAYQTITNNITEIQEKLRWVSIS